MEKMNTPWRKVKQNLRQNTKVKRDKEGKISADDEQILATLEKIEEDESKTAENEGLATSAQTNAEGDNARNTAQAHILLSSLLM